MQLNSFRTEFIPKVCKALQDISTLTLDSVSKFSVPQEILPFFQNLKDFSLLQVKRGEKKAYAPLSVGVVFSGGQAAGGHNVIAALYDTLKGFHKESTLFGFLNGPSGIVKKEYMLLTEKEIHPYRNEGGFDLIGSGRTKIETEEQFQEAFKCVQDLKLSGLVIIGGDDSNTNAAHLAEYFLKKGCNCAVIGVPKTIDGDLQNEKVAISFGFDTACKVYSETIGNIAKDALSAKKYYYFIKLMGRTASHITLECALQTHPNMALVSEEIAQKKETLAQVASNIADLIVSRSQQGKDFGVILVPEGVIEFMSDIKALIKELNNQLATSQDVSQVMKLLTPASKTVFESLPLRIQEQLLLDRDPHGNVQVSKIETERLLISMVEVELEKRKEKGEYKGKFSAQPIFCGYEGRSAFPSNFDATYCYNLGVLSALLIALQKTGYMAAIADLQKPQEEWQPFAVPLVPLMDIEERKGVKKAVVKKTLVDLKKKPFQTFAKERETWKMNDDYLQPGPMQFFGPKELVDSIPLTLKIVTS